MTDLSNRLISGVKGFEGFSTRPYWDFKQYTSGYGTKAGSPNETIDQATASSRLQDALSGAAAQVDKAFPGLSAGTRDALVSLTYNAGPGWMSSGLGNALRSGNVDQARDLFAQYNKAGGQTNPGLVARRQAELGWFDGQPPRPPMPIPNVPSQAPQFQSMAMAQTAPNLPLFSPQAQAQPDQPIGKEAPQSIFSFLAPPTSQNDLANWFARMNPQG